MRHDSLRNIFAPFGGKVLTTLAVAILLVSTGRASQAQSLQRFTLSGHPDRVAFVPPASFKIDRYQPLLGIGSTGAPLEWPAPVTVTAPAPSRQVVQPQAAGARRLARECPMPVMRADSSHSKGMPVTRADSVSMRLDVGGTLVGCANPLAR